MSYVSVSGPMVVKGDVLCHRSNLAYFGDSSRMGEIRLEQVDASCLLRAREKGPH